MATKESKVRRILNTVKEDGRRIKNALDNFKSELDLSDARERDEEIAAAADSGSGVSDAGPDLMVMTDRKFFGDFLQKELLRCENYGYPLSIMRIEVGLLHEADENCPHPVSKETIQECTRNLQSCIRRSDKVAQLHDGEFFILLPETDETHSQYVLRRIGTKLNNHSESFPGGPLKFQIACASCNNHIEAQRALHNLLKSKRPSAQAGDPPRAESSGKIWN